MRAEEHSLCGIGPITGQFLENLLSRHGKRSRELPVVVLLGVRGVGKSAVLAELRRRCAKLPCSQLDFERRDWEEIEPWELVGHIAFDLGRHVHQFGRLAFPRLLLCMLALRTPVAGDRNAALDKLQEVIAADQPLEHHRETIVELLKGFASAGKVSVPGLVEATDLMLRGLSRIDRWRLARRVREIPSQAGKPEDFLVEIARSAHGDDVDRARLGAFLCDAFLADLRRGYTGPKGSVRTLNSVLLLDNAHTSGGQAFLRELTEARRRAPGGDPLVVFAASRTWNPDWTESWSQITTAPGEHDRNRRSAHRTAGLVSPEPRRPSDVEDDWSGDTGDERSRWHPWYLIELGALSAGDVGDIAAEHGIRRTSPVPAFLHRLTDGHPGAVHTVLPAVWERWDPDNPAALRESLFARPGAPGEGAPMLLDEVSDALLQEFSDAERRQLVTASAAADVEMLFNNELLAPHAPVLEGALFERLKDGLWLRTDPGDRSRFVLHPWLRRVLLRELALRPDDDESSWARTHRRCRDFYLGEDRVTEARYHELAIEDFRPVITHLRASLDVPHAEFGDDAAERWLAELYAVTAAPNRLVEDADPYGQVESRAAGWEDDLSTNLAWLVVSLWISRDPLGDPGGRLNPTIRQCFHLLAHARGHGSMKLHQHAEVYR